MICPNCHREQDNNRFCIQCGYPLENFSEADNKDENRVREPEGSRTLPTDGKKRKSKFFNILLTLLSPILFLIVTILCIEVLW